MKYPVVFIMCVLFSPFQGNAQHFTLVADSTNPVVVEPDCGTENNWPNSCFQGAVWVNLNGDNRPDLFYAGKVILNLGNGNFSKGQGINLSGIDTQLSMTQ